MSDGMEIRGKASYVPKSTRLAKIEFDRLMFGRTNVKGALILRSDGVWDLGFQGPSFDFSAYWDELFLSPLADDDKNSFPKKKRSKQ